MRLDDGGYLVDPSSEFGKYANPDLKSSEELSTFSALVLLGEPGIGKSHVIATNFEQPEFAPDGTAVLFADLREYSSDALLYQRLFRAPQVEVWLGGSGQLILQLDSLDEALLRVDTVATLLAGELSRCWPTERLKLRIACRTAVWPDEVLEPVFEGIWGKENVGVFELAPLRAKDVGIAARARNIDDQKFMETVRRADAEAFASKPLTLNLLLNLFRKEQVLGNNSIDVYERGCRTLCEEPSPLRRAGARHSALAAADRIAIAGRIAAVTMFSNRFAIWTSPDLGNVPAEDVKLDALEGGTEQVKDRTVSVTGVALDATLDTGLFTSRGQGRMGWAHQGYGEFLAALYLKDETISARTAAKLVLHQDGGLVPQLQQVAAWLAAMRSDVRHKIIKADPKVMLFSDLSAMDDEDRSATTEEFLRALDERRDFDLDIGLRQRYRKLNHNGLADQLRPYIVNSSKNMVVRRAAIEIAEMCDVRALAHELLAIALNEGEDAHVRARAVHALGILGSEPTILQLKRLTTGDPGHDPDDELKGHSLAILWPGHMTARELFATLTPRKRANLIGSYAMFLEYRLPEGLAADDLPIALNWVSRTADRKPSRHRREYNLLEDKILARALNHINEPGVAEAFARAAFIRLKRGHQIFDFYAREEIETWKDFMNHIDRRRRILRGMITLLQEDRGAVFLFDLVRAEDVPWLTEMLSACERKADPQLNLNALARLVSFALDPSDSAHFELVYEYAQHSSVLRRHLGWLLEPIELGSERAVALRESHERKNQQTFEDHEVNECRFSQAHIEQLLREVEAGEVESWWRLNLSLMLEEDSRYYQEQEMDITKMPGWSTSEEETRVRLLVAAERYLSQCRPVVEPLGKIQQWRPNLAGYRAMALLKAEAPDHLAGLPSEIWRVWAPVLLAVFAGNSPQQLQVQQELVGDSYRFAPLEIASMAESLIRWHKRNAPSQPLHFLDRLENCWETPELRNLLLKELTKRKLTLPQLESVLQSLLEHDDEKALRWAINCFYPKAPTKPEKRQLASAAAKAVVLFAARRAWGKVWAAVQDDAEFGKELFLSVANEFDWRGKRLDSFESQHLGDQFIWLETHFPRAEDTDDSVEDGHRVGPRDRLARWRDQILRHLAQQATPEAIEALRKAERAFPELSWIRIHIVDAERQMRRATWIPLKPAEVIQLKRIKGGELVENTEDLLELILGGLQDYQEWIDQNPARTAQQLWNKQEGRSRQADHAYHPAEENDFSDNVRDYLSGRLTRQGVVINREVEISRRPGSPIGHRTDIQVDAIRKSSIGSELDRITVPIETKGCWNRALKNAMRTQLVEDYMNSINATMGIYLVGWFSKSKWDGNDRRRGQVPDWDVNQARAFFNEQAAELSDETGNSVRAFVVDCGF